MALLLCLVPAFLIARDELPDAARLKRADENIRQALFGRAVLHQAESFIGTPYVWGGKDPKADGGLDCSGFTQAVMKRFGLEIPAGAMAQYEDGQGIGIEKPALSAGDLVFFLSSSAKTSMHVGIYAGGNFFIHAPGEGKKIQKDSMEKSYFAGRYVGARRFMPQAKATTTEEKKP
jgi:cell wall-associated NlpC family hydrolase